jgi:hypothetical protein
MSIIIQFISNISEDEQLLIEIQGGITHTIENKFNFMFLGKLTKNSQVRLYSNLINSTLFQLFKKFENLG